MNKSSGAGFPSASATRHLARLLICELPLLPPARRLRMSFKEFRELIRAIIYETRKWLEL